MKHRKGKIRAGQSWIFFMVITYPFLPLRSSTFMISSATAFANSGGTALALIAHCSDKMRMSGQEVVELFNNGNISKEDVELPLISGVRPSFEAIWNAVSCICTWFRILLSRIRSLIASVMVNTFSSSYNQQIIAERFALFREGEDGASLRNRVMTEGIDIAGLPALIAHWSFYLKIQNCRRRTVFLLILSP